MTRFGKIIKETFPKLYDFLTVNVLKIREVKVFYIMDAFGSFKEYFAENEMPAKVATLLQGFDKKSVQTFQTIYARLQNYPDSRFKQFMPAEKNEIIGGILEEENIKFDQFKIKKDKGLKIKSFKIHSSAFYFLHGLTLLPPKVNKAIIGRSVLDLGAYEGDTVLALNDYNFRKIYAVEMSPKTIEEFERNMLANEIGKEKYEVINCAVSNSEGEININDNGSIGLSLINKFDSKEKSTTIRQRTVDSLVSEYDIRDLAFIKADVEGFALECMQGGINSIKKQRPVLSIAIYHSPVEFFEVKPYLEKELDNYVFLLRRLAQAKEYGACHAETVLLAYPKELE